MKFKPCEESVQKKCEFMASNVIGSMCDMCMIWLIFSNFELWPQNGRNRRKKKRLRREITENTHRNDSIVYSHGFCIFFSFYSFFFVAAFCAPIQVRSIHVLTNFAFLILFLFFVLRNESRNLYVRCMFCTLLTRSDRLLAF